MSLSDGNHWVNVKFDSIAWSYTFKKQLSALENAIIKIMPNNKKGQAPGTTGTLKTGSLTVVINFFV